MPPAAGGLSISLLASWAVLRTGTLPVGLQGRSALPVGDTPWAKRPAQVPDRDQAVSPRRSGGRKAVRPACREGGRLSPLRLAFDDLTSFRTPKPLCGGELLLRNPTASAGRRLRPRRFSPSKRSGGCGIRAARSRESGGIPCRNSGRWENRRAGRFRRCPRGC